MGYIRPGAAEVSGTIGIRAFIDADKIAVTDTYDGTESRNTHTTSDWVAGRVVLTTAEWLITPYNDTYVHHASTGGNMQLYSSTSNVTNLYSVRPAITLKSNVIITGGTGYVGGNTNSPFEIAESNNS